MGTQRFISVFLLAALLITSGVASAAGVRVLFSQDLGPVTIIATQNLLIKGRMESANTPVEPGDLVSTGKFTIKNPTAESISFSIRFDPSENFLIMVNFAEAPQALSEKPAEGTSSSSASAIVVISPGSEVGMGIVVNVRNDAQPTAIKALKLYIEETSVSTPPCKPGGCG